MDPELESRGNDARAILRWVLDPRLAPFTPELEQAAARCAATIIKLIKQQTEGGK